MLLHNEFRMFSFAKVLVWMKENKPSIRYAWIIKEVHYGPNQDLFQVHFYLTMSLLCRGLSLRGVHPRATLERSKSYLFNSRYSLESGFA